MTREECLIWQRQTKGEPKLLARIPIRTFMPLEVQLRYAVLEAQRQAVPWQDTYVEYQKEDDTSSHGMVFWDSRYVNVK